MGDAASQVALRAAQARERADQMGGEDLDIIGTAVREFGLGEAPDALVGVQVGGVGREARYVESRKRVAEVVNQWPSMDAPVVPEHDHRPAQVAEHVPEEGADLGGPDVRAVELVVETQTAPARADGQAGDHGDLVVSLPEPEEGGLPPRRPGLADARDQEEAGFVDEDEVGAQPRGVFFTRAHSRRFHSAIRASSRSSARVSGFWWLHPSWCISRPTWSRW